MPLRAAAIAVFAALLAGPPAGAADFVVEPLLDGRFRPEHYALLRVTGPASASADAPVMRIVVRPVDSEDSVEFSAQTGQPRGGKVTAVVPTVLYSPAVARLRVSTRDERDRVLAEADVEIAAPGLRPVPTAERLAIAVSGNPTAALNALNASGKTAALRLTTAGIKHEDLPANHAGTEAADLLIVDFSYYQDLLPERKDLLRSWALTHGSEAVDAAFGGPLLLFDPAGAAGKTIDRGLFKSIIAPSGVGAPVFWVMAGRTERGALPLGLEMEAGRRAVLEPTVANRPRLAPNEVRMLAAGAVAFAIVIAAIGLFTAGAGRGGFGACLAGVAALLFSGAAAWLVPARGSARVDVLEIVEITPAAKAGEPAFARRMLYVGVAGLRGTDAIVSTSGLEALLPVFPGPSFQGRIPLRLETTPTGRQDVVVRCRSVLRKGELEADPRGGFRPALYRALPVYGLIGTWARVENLPLELIPAGDGKTVTLKTGAGWSRRLTDCVILDVPGPASLVGRVALREKARFAEPRVISVGNLERGPNPPVPVDLLAEKSSGSFIDAVRVLPTDDEPARLRKAALRAAAGNDMGACRLTAPWLIGWSDLPPQAALGSLPDKLTGSEPSQLVFIRLDGLFKGPAAKP